MNIDELRSSIIFCQKRIDNPTETSPFLQLFFMSKDWSRILQHQKLCAVYRPPTIVLGTDDFQGEKWFKPAHVVILPYLACPVKGELSGRGVSWVPGEHLKLYTELDELLGNEKQDGTFEVVDFYDVDTIVNYIFLWKEQLARRA